MATAYVLLQFGSDLFSHRFEDLESRPAFTVYVRQPVCTLSPFTRPFPDAGKPSVLSHTHHNYPDCIQGTRNPQLCRPSRKGGRVVSTAPRHYGPQQRLPLLWSKQDARLSRVRERRRSSDGTAHPTKKGWQHVRPTCYLLPTQNDSVYRSRYFTTQHKKELKWKVAPQKMEVIPPFSLLFLLSDQ